MSVLLYQYQGSNLYRVMRKVGDTYKQKYFPKTRAGKKRAQAYDEQLRIEQLCAATSAGSHYRMHETHSKGFPTGVVGIRLDCRANKRGCFDMPRWSASFVRDNKINVFGRSIARLGYDEAWNEVCQYLWRARDINPKLTPIPPPPPKRKAKAYLKASGYPPYTWNFL